MFERVKDAALAPARRHIAMLGFPDAEMLDIVGPLEIFAAANAVLARAEPPTEPAYTIEILGLRAGAFTTVSGLRLDAARAYAAVFGGIDTLLVAGGGGVQAVAADAAVLDWLRDMAPRVRRLGSVCTGIYVLAAAGMLSGRRAATHWLHCDAVARRHADVTVDRDAIFVRDGKIYTSAGITSGMDLALALVEEDLGRQVALDVARRLVMFVKRPGGQSQFSAHLAAQMTGPAPLARAQAWALAHLAEDLPVETLAGQAAMSPRTFARTFARETGTTPAKWVEGARVDAARRELEGASGPLEAVAFRCGFRTVERMRRAFLRALGIAPNEYRARFRPRPEGTESRNLQEEDHRAAGNA